MAETNYNPVELPTEIICEIGKKIGRGGLNEIFDDK
jgi:hypothetical protein